MDNGFTHTGGWFPAGYLEELGRLRRIAELTEEHRQRIYTFFGYRRGHAVWDMCSKLGQISTMTCLNWADHFCGWGIYLSERWKHELRRAYREERRGPFKFRVNY